MTRVWIVRLSVAMGLLAAMLLSACTITPPPEAPNMPVYRPSSYYEARLAEDPDSLWALRRLGSSLFYEGKLGQAEQVLGEVVARVPGDWYGCWYLGMTQILAGQREQGFATIQEIVIPFEYWMKKEMVCSGAHVQKKDLDNQASVSLLLDYLDTILQRQRARKTIFGRDRAGAPVMGDCPPMLLPRGAPVVW